MTAATVDHRMNSGDRSTVYVDYKLSSSAVDEDESEMDKRMNARRLSVSRSGRCKNRTQLRVKLPSEDQYRGLDSGTSPAVGGVSCLTDTALGGLETPSKQLSGAFTPPTSSQVSRLFNSPGGSSTANAQVIRAQETIASSSVNIPAITGGAGRVDKKVTTPSSGHVRKTDIEQSSTSSMSSEDNNAILSPSLSPAWQTLTIFNESADGENIESTAF